MPQKAPNPLPAPGTRPKQMPPAPPAKSHVKRLTPTPAEPAESVIGKALKARVQKFLTLYDEIKRVETDAETRLKVLREEYDAVHADLLGDMNVAGLDLLKGPETGGRGIKKEKKTVATIEDFDAICGYIKEHDAFELLQKRLSTGAVAERQEQGEVIPGVGKFDKIQLKVTK